jgi:glutaredoxin-like protein NrdH
MPETVKRVMLYAISTCGHCRNTKKWLKENNIEYDWHDVDLLHGDEKRKCLDDVRQYNPRLTFPTMIIDGETVIIGYHPEEFEEVFSNGEEDG